MGFERFCLLFAILPFKRPDVLVIAEQQANQNAKNAKHGKEAGGSASFAESKEDRWQAFRRLPAHQWLEDAVNGKSSKEITQRNGEKLK